MEFNFDIKRVQDRLLEIAKRTATILEKHDIPYQIAFGTLLGAIRHGGFIPWDDDFDFFLFEESYEKAMDVLAQELPSDMFLENEKSEPKYFHGWAHVKDVNSECQCDLYPHDSLYAHKGVSVDLYKMTKIHERDFAQFRLDNAIAYIERRKQLGFITEEDFEKRKKLYAERLLSEKCDSDKVILAYPFDHGKQNYEDVFPLKKYTFCGVEFLGPNNYESILTSEYGDYMQLPPEEDRHPHFSSVTFFDEK